MPRLSCRGPPLWGPSSGLWNAVAHPFGDHQVGCGVSDMAADTISSLGRLLGQHLGISPFESTRHLYQRLAISLCASVCSYAPVHFPLQLVLSAHFYLFLTAPRVFCTSAHYSFCSTIFQCIRKFVPLLCTFFTFFCVCLVSPRFLRICPSF